ncbi:hypothetical protein FPV67DRAFT_1667401 [Lyophyllum atratum]|nr:hypothetical protein FPV67DRAFT_1667401 [Lyophyllum atratum]
MAIFPIFVVGKPAGKPSLTSLLPRRPSFTSLPTIPPLDLGAPFLGTVQSLPGTVHTAGRAPSPPSPSSSVLGTVQSLPGTSPSSSVVSILVFNHDSHLYTDSDATSDSGYATSFSGVLPSAPPSSPTSSISDSEEVLASAPSISISISDSSASISDSEEVMPSAPPSSPTSSIEPPSSPTSSIELLLSAPPRPSPPRPSSPPTSSPTTPISALRHGFPLGPPRVAYPYLARTAFRLPITKDCIELPNGRTLSAYRIAKPDECKQRIALDDMVELFDQDHVVELFDGEVYQVRLFKGVVDRVYLFHQNSVDVVLELISIAGYHVLLLVPRHLALVDTKFRGVFTSFFLSRRLPPAPILVQASRTLHNQPIASAGAAYRLMEVMDGPRCFRCGYQGSGDGLGPILHEGKRRCASRRACKVRRARRARRASCDGLSSRFLRLVAALVGCGPS